MGKQQRRSTGRGRNWRSWPSGRQASVKLAPDMHRRLKVRAAREGVKLQELVAGLLMAALGGGDVVAGEMAYGEPIAWAVLCAGGMPHARELHTAPRKPELLELDRRMCDAQGCGPHRIVPLFAGEASRG